MEKPILVSPTSGRRGMNDLHYAAYCNDVESVRTLLAQGADIDARDDNGWTPLHWSIDMAQTSKEAEEVVALLLKAGASAKAVDNSNFSVLMMACGRSKIAIVKRLLDSGADAHCRANDGTTALHEAAGGNFTEAIALLLTLGADRTALDSSNRTAADLAAECEFENSEKLLRTYP